MLQGLEWPPEHLNKTQGARYHRSPVLHAQDWRREILIPRHFMCRVPVESPDRFRMELLFSAGASHDPYSVVPLKQDHTLPIASRSPLHEGVCFSHPATATTVLIFAALTPFGVLLDMCQAHMHYEIWEYC